MSLWMIPVISFAVVVVCVAVLAVAAQVIIEIFDSCGN